MDDRRQMRVAIIEDIGAGGVEERGTQRIDALAPADDGRLGTLADAAGFVPSHSGQDAQREALGERLIASKDSTSASIRLAMNTTCGPAGELGNQERRLALAGRFQRLRQLRTVRPLARLNPTKDATMAPPCAPLDLARIGAKCCVLRHRYSPVRGGRL
jgi:hypothetical protein